MDDMIYDLENKIEMLKEQPEYAGFMKNRFVVYNTGNQRYGMFYNTHTSNGTYVPNSLFQREAIMKKIKDELSASDYETLQYTTYESSKETIKNYIEILNHLVDKGIFDILEPKIPPCPNEMNDDGISSQFQLSDKVKLRVDHDLTKTPCKQSFDHDPTEMLEKDQLSRKKKKEELLDGQLTEAAKKCFWNVNEDTSLFKQLPCVTITFDHINGDPDKIKPLFDCPNGKLIFTGDDTCLTKEKIKFSVLIGDIYNRQRFMTKLLTTFIEDVKTSPNVSDDGDHNGTDYTGPPPYVNTLQ